MSDTCTRRMPDGTRCGFAWSAHDGSAAPSGCRLFRPSAARAAVPVLLILFALVMGALLLTGVIHA